LYCCFLAHAYFLLAFVLLEGLKKYLRNSWNLGIYPGLKATEGTEVIMLDRTRTFPARNSQPAFKHLAGWLSRRTLHYLTTGMTGKAHSFRFHFLFFYPNRG